MREGRGRRRKGEGEGRESVVHNLVPKKTRSPWEMQYSILYEIVIRLYTCTWGLHCAL